MASSKANSICIAGGSGFIGKAIRSHLLAKGYDVEIIQRSVYQGNPDQLSLIIEGCKAVINLAGASIAKRWSPGYKREILSSRTVSTQTISNAFRLCKQAPERFISASATGIYDSVHDHDESSTALANGFLADVCLQWENEALHVQDLTKLSIIRLGVVLGRGGGSLKKLWPLFRSGLGGRLGHGLQAFPYIHIADACAAITHILEQENPAPLYNLVSPQQINNRMFTSALAKACRRPAIMIIPGFILRLVMGKAAVVLLEGQRVKPAQLLHEHFNFRFSSLNQENFFNK